MSSIEEKLEVIKELNYWYEERDKEFPEWYQKRRRLARKIYEEYERKGMPIGKYGKDYDFTRYQSHIAKPHSQHQSLLELSEVEQQYLQTIGARIDEEERTGSHLQEDLDTTYTAFSESAKLKFLPKYPEGLVVMNPDEAVHKFSWIKDYFHRLVPLKLDKFTALASGYSIGGAFVWVKKGVAVELPLQACFWMETNRFAQLPYILVIAEPYSKVHIISGCVVEPICPTGIHGCVTEIYVGEGAEITFNIIHNFKPGYWVSPKVGALVDENGVYKENYISIGKHEATQLYPTVILRGKDSRASIRSLFFGRGNSDMDIGAGVVFTGENTRAEIITRAVILDESIVRMRGSLKGYIPTARGHLECRGLLLSDKAQALAYPNLKSISPDAMLTHEAAIGKIAEEELHYLMSRGLSKSEATSMIVRGFLDTEIPGLPSLLQAEITRLVSMTAEEVM